MFIFYLVSLVWYNIGNRMLFFFLIIDLRFLTLKKVFGANIDPKDKGCLRVSLEAKSRITFLESFSLRSMQKKCLSALCFQTR